jgi:hypothetical protein
MYALVRLLAAGGPPERFDPHKGKTRPHARVHAFKIDLRKIDLRVRLQKSTCV